MDGFLGSKFRSTQVRRGVYCRRNLGYLGFSYIYIFFVNIHMPIIYNQNHKTKRGWAVPLWVGRLGLEGHGWARIRGVVLCYVGRNEVVGRDTREGAESLVSSVGMGWAWLRNGVNRGVVMRVGLYCNLVTKFLTLVAKISRAGRALGVFSIKARPNNTNIPLTHIRAKFLYWEVTVPTHIATIYETQSLI